MISAKYGDPSGNFQPEMISRSAPKRLIWRSLIASQPPLFRTTKTTLTPLMAAAAISVPVCRNAPSPTSARTGLSGAPIAAPIAAGTPNPIPENPPATMLLFGS